MDGVEWSDGPMREGHRAYAQQQAEQFRAMHAHCEYLWRYVDEYVQVGDGMVIPPDLRVAHDDELL